jgi:apolipoprotein N-acyltransferase
MLLVIAASILFALALPNELFLFGNALLGLIALVPLYIALRRASSWRIASRLGALFGFVSTVLSNFWLMFFEDYSIWTIGGTAVGYTAYNYLLGGFLWLVLRSNRSLRVPLFALMWTGYEYLKSVGFLGYPWGLSGYPFNSIVPLIQIVDVTGVWALSLMAVYFNAVVAELLLDPPQIKRFSATMRHAAMVALLVAVALSYGALRLRSDIPVKDRLTMTLVQQNVDTWNTSNPSAALAQIQETTLEAVEEFEGDLDLIVWSETSLRYIYADHREWFRENPRDTPFLPFLEALPAPLLTGAPHFDADRDEYYNAALLLENDGYVDTWYGKQQLVPFAEAIPFWEMEFVRVFFREVVGLSSTWSAGPGYELFTVEGEGGNAIAIGTPICFEDGFARVTAGFVRNGADLLVNLTNNAWSRTNSAQTQHFVASRFRSIESRRTLVRSTNAGYTTVVDPWGRELAALPMFERDTLTVRVPVYVTEAPTIYLIWGDYLPIAILSLFAVLGGCYRWRITKKGTPRRPFF